MSGSRGRRDPRRRQGEQRTGAAWRRAIRNADGAHNRTIEMRVPRMGDRKIQDAIERLERVHEGAISETTEELDRLGVLEGLSREQREVLARIVLDVKRDQRAFERNRSKWRTAALKQGPGQIHRLQGPLQRARSALQNAVQTARRVGVGTAADPGDLEGNVYLARWLDANVIPYLQRALEALKRARLPNPDARGYFSMMLAFSDPTLASRRSLFGFLTSECRLSQKATYDRISTIENGLLNGNSGPEAIRKSLERQSMDN